MTITRERILIEVTMSADSGIVFANYSDVVKENGTVIVSQPRRESFFPGADMSKEDARVQSFCSLAWTDAIRSAWAAKMAALPPVSAP